MSHVTVTVAGRHWALRYLMWVVANDCPRRFVSVDLHAAPTP